VHALLLVEQSLTDRIDILELPVPRRNDDSNRELFE
jgi:hypothetical protein